MATEQKELFLHDQQNAGLPQSSSFQIQRGNMTPILENSRIVSDGTMAGEGTLEEGDIPIDLVNGTGNLPGGAANSLSAGAAINNIESYPLVIPSNPIFAAPANPLLPEEYNELLDYNTIQYMNGFFRTQIGKYVRVELLMGSNIQQEYDGFLIGVGVNYIILQEYSSQNIRVIDIYSVKNMYVYYVDLPNPEARA